MWNSLFHSTLPMSEFVIRALAVYLFVLLMLRMGGKRQLAQMSPTEFVAVLLISNAVQNSMNGGDNSLVGGFVLALVLIIASTSISYLTFRSRKFRHIFEGVPTILIHCGKLIEKNLRKERISRDELTSMLRRQDVHHMDNIQEAILEPDGELTVLLKNDFLNIQIRQRTRGEVNQKDIDSANKDAKPGEDI
jgi:uncharacterized membrane protein YcaP (DUF421 family)